jgi:hypothetical protein
MTYLEQLKQIAVNRGVTLDELYELSDGMTAGDEELIRARELFMILSTLEFA